MKTLLPLLAVSVLLAYFSQVNSGRCMAKNREYRAINDPAYVLLVVILILFSGLRTSYNDTFNYMNGYRKAPELAEFLSTLNFRMIFTNPLFNFYESTLKTLTDNPQWLIFTSSVFTQICFVRFIKRYSSDFTISIFIYFTLGTFVFTLAAIKQVLAMAVLTLSIPALEKRQWLKYYVLVFVAMLIHTYALAFAVLPLFRSKPWSLFTFVFIAVLTAVMMNFEQAITSFMEQANDLGKSLAEYEVFDDATINVFRLAVYSVPPLISLVCRKWVLHNSRELDNILVHMSIISLAFMIMGTQSGANMFGRMGNYFELGMICCLPAMLSKTFDKKSYRLITAISCLCFMGFFTYANAVNIDFDQHYRAISLWKLLFP